MSNFGIAVEGIESLEDVSRLDGAVSLAAVQTVNKVARDMRALSAREVSKQLDLPASRVSNRKGRLWIAQQAQQAKPEAIIRASARPTSLARYVKGSPRRGEAVTVEVTPGRSVRIPRAFLIKLRAGSELTDTKNNLGLAVRLGEGQSLRNSLAAKRLSDGLYLLYGPSVQQVFLDNAGEGIAKDISPEAATRMEREFLRLIELKGY